MNVYFDASVVVSLFISDPLSDRAETFIRERSPTPCVSDFAAAEFASAVNRRVRMALLPHAEARIALANFDLWRQGGVTQLKTASRDVETADAYLRRLDLPLRAPDALNIALADRAGALLATFDGGMARCARTLGVALVEI